MPITSAVPGKLPPIVPTIPSVAAPFVPAPATPPPVLPKDFESATPAAKAAYYKKLEPICEEPVTGLVQDPSPELPPSVRLEQLPEALQTLVDELRVFHPIPKAGSLLVNTGYKSGLYTASFDAPVHATNAKHEQIWLPDLNGKWYAKTDTQTTHAEVVISEMPDSHGQINATVVLVGGSGDWYDGPNTH